jgi:hypothetical protein
MRSSIFRVASIKSGVIFQLEITSFYGYPKDDLTN